MVVVVVVLVVVALVVVAVLVVVLVEVLVVVLHANTPIRPHPFYAVHLGISNVRLYSQLGRSTRVFRGYKFATPVKLLDSLTIFNKGLILPPPLNFYIH